MEVQLNDLKPEYNIIDIRDRYSYDIDHVYNSINIPMYELLNNYQYYLNKNDTYYIYCKSGIRSKKTCNILNMFGYNVINVKDGFGK
ncbi:MAG: rhodanese-like domain-containing protein [Bacilli bacterium]|nr:rhodanese-like domain-containing protein [Bacilli bacterium]